MGYSKVLIARNSPENGCHAIDGEWLIIGQDVRKIKGRLPEDHHFFVGIESKQPSRYGWVHDIDREIKPKDLAEELNANPSPELIDSCRLLLDAVGKQEPGTPMACTYSTIGIIEKKRVLRVHKIVFYDEKERPSL